MKYSGASIHMSSVTDRIVSTLCNINLFTDINVNSNVVVNVRTEMRLLWFVLKQATQPFLHKQSWSIKFFIYTLHGGYRSCMFCTTKL